MNRWLSKNREHDDKDDDEDVVYAPVGCEPWLWQWGRVPTGTPRKSSSIGRGH